MKVIINTNGVLNLFFQRKYALENVYKIVHHGSYVDIFTKWGKGLYIFGIEKIGSIEVYNDDYIFKEEDF